MEDKKKKKKVKKNLAKRQTKPKSKNIKVTKEQKLTKGQKTINTLKVVINNPQKKTRSITQQPKQMSAMDKFIIAQNNLRNDIQRELAIQKKEKEDRDKELDELKRYQRQLQVRQYEQLKRESKINEDAKKQFDFLKEQRQRNDMREQELQNKSELLFKKATFGYDESVSGGGGDVPFAFARVVEEKKKNPVGRPRKQPGDPPGKYTKRKDKEKQAEEKQAEEKQSEKKQAEKKPLSMSDIIDRYAGRLSPVVDE